MKRPRPKYQVFVSSTYSDLREQRLAVSWEVLKARHIPSGMENFSATDDRGWQIIQRTIDQSDYYVLLLGGRYGSVDPTTGMSWTEREYDYARSICVPVMAFVRDPSNIPSNLAEDDSTLRERLKSFSKKVRDARLCETWTTTEDLVARVGLALRNAIDDDEDSGNARPGWYRGDQVPNWTVSEELARLSAENQLLRARVESLGVEKVAVLQLTSGDSPIPDRLDPTIPRLVVSRDRQDGYATQILLYGGSGSLEDYVSRAQRTLWLPLRIRNIGERPARDVVATLQFTGVEDVILHRRDRPPNVLAVPSVHKPRYLDPQQHVFVDSVSRAEERVTVVQRVRSIAVGGEEKLVRVGVVFPLPVLEPQETAATQLNYTIISENGERAEGSCVVCARVAGEQQLSISEIADL